MLTSPFFSGKLRSGLSPAEEGPHGYQGHPARGSLGPTCARGSTSSCSSTRTARSRCPQRTCYSLWGKRPPVSARPRDRPLPAASSQDVHSTCCANTPETLDAGEGQSLNDLLLEMASTASSAYFLRLLFFCPRGMSTGPSLGPPPPKLQTTLQSVPPACGRDSRLSQLLSYKGGRCSHHTSAHHGTVSRRYSVGRDCRRARGSSYSWLGGCHPTILWKAVWLPVGGCLHGAGWCLLLGPAPRWRLAAWATPLSPAHRGLDGLREAGSALRGPPSSPWAP